MNVSIETIIISLIIVFIIAITTGAVIGSIYQKTNLKESRECLDRRWKYYYNHAYRAQDELNKKINDLVIREMKIMEKE
jgi:hypothetical protein